MGWLVDELQRREVAARAEAERLRGQIAELSERLAGVGEQLSRLVIARDVVDEVLAGASTAEASPMPGLPEVPASPGAGHLPDRKLDPYGGRQPATPGQLGYEGWAGPGVVTVSGVTLRSVASDVAVTVNFVLQAAAPASGPGSMGARMTFLPGLRRSISRILSRVWRARLRGVW